MFEIWIYNTRKYSETKRQFCMGLDFLLPAAYRYMRRVFNKNVALAAEVMSNSTAYCIDQLRDDNYEAFQGSYETSEFIVHVNNVFDICNAKTNRPPSGYKQPICESNAEELFQYFQKVKEYFMSIEIDKVNTKTKEVRRKLAIQSRSKTPFLGMVYNMTALQGLYNDYSLKFTHSNFPKTIWRLGFRALDEVLLQTIILRQLTSNVWTESF